MSAPTRLFGVDHESTTDDWYTPPWIFEGMDVQFDLDVAAPPTGADWVTAKHRYTETDNGLLQPWHGTVWCNPPYSAPTAWCRRWANHADGCILIRADLSTRGPHTAFTAAHAVYFAERRIQFVNGQGGKTGAVNFTTVLLARGEACTAGLHRLASIMGGCTRDLRDPFKAAGSAESTPK